MINKCGGESKNILKNTGITFFTQIFNLFLKFILQRAFLVSLGVQYLGYSSVFNDILQMLNMADLGIGIAITSYLYKPIADNDINRINALMYLYKKIYKLIGIAVMAIGLIILVLVPFIINDASCDDNYLRVLFLINLIGAVSTYFLAYRRTLLIAQQKAYFTNEVDFIINLVTSIIQIVLLMIFPNYILYLSLTVAKNIFSNIIISINCKKANPYITNEPDIEMAKNYKAPIFAYVKDVFIAKIGAYVYHGTDNIIISTLMGSVWTGYLANYSLITIALRSIITQVFSSLQATYGNYIATTPSLKKQKEITDMYYFVNYLVGNICFIDCVIAFQIFIKLYIGSDYILEDSTVMLLSVNLCLTLMMIIPSQVFVIYKLYHYDKPVIIISAILNIIVSVILVKEIGINGALIGTTFTSLIYLISRMYIISKKVYKTSYLYYIFRFIKWFISSLMTYYICKWISGFFRSDSWIKLIILCLICSIVAIVVPVLINFQRIGYQKLFKKLNN